jgi:hypothetical protein
MSIEIEINIDEEICCICLDECNSHKKIVEKIHARFKCCHCPIHKKCLIILFLNNFNTCPLCRSTIDVKDYYNNKEILRYLSLDEIQLYKERLSTIMYELNDGYFFSLIILHIILIMNTIYINLLKIIKFTAIILILNIILYTCIRHIQLRE